MEYTDPITLHKDDTLEHFWYAIYVRSRHEFKVFDRLTRAGIEAFLPSVERLRKWKDRKKIINFPLFPGYLFVRIRRSALDIMKVLKTDGVVRFVGFEPRKPEAIPEEQIESLQRLIESKEDINPYPYLKEGQRVRVKRGPLQGAEGILVKRKDRHLLIVSIDILMRSVSVQIDASDVEAI